MRKNAIILFLICVTSSLLGQNIRQDILKELNLDRQGEGKIKVLQDESIKNTIAVHAESDSLDIPRLSNEMVKGYKVQAFVGNSQNASRQEAEERQSLIRGVFPQHQAVITYNSPSWRLRVGNFINKYQAEQFLDELKKAFPKFGKEMYVVNDMVRKPLK